MRIVLAGLELALKCQNFVVAKGSSRHSTTTGRINWFPVRTQSLATSGETRAEDRQQRLQQEELRKKYAIIAEILRKTWS